MQMKEVMLMERDTRSHSPQALHKEREIFTNNTRIKANLFSKIYPFMV